MRKEHSDREDGKGTDGVPETSDSWVRAGCIDCRPEDALIEGSGAHLYRTPAIILSVPIMAPIGGASATNADTRVRRRVAPTRMVVCAGVVGLRSDQSAIDPTWRCLARAPTGNRSREQLRNSQLGTSAPKKAAGRRITIMFRAPTTHPVTSVE